jgi:hypothetical protein
VKVLITFLFHFFYSLNINLFCSVFNFVRKNLWWRSAGTWWTINWGNCSILISLPFSNCFVLFWFWGFQKNCVESLFLRFWSCMFELFHEIGSLDACFDYDNSISWFGFSYEFFMIKFDCVGLIYWDLIYGFCYGFFVLRLLVVVMKMMNRLLVVVVRSDCFLNHVNFCIISLFFVNHNYVFVWLWLIAFFPLYVTIGLL